VVKIYADDDPTKVVGHEPPYTEEEEMDFYRRIGGGPVTMYRGPRETKMTYEQLEEKILPLLARRDAAEEGSAEYHAAIAEIGKMLDKHPDAQLICEEYNSQSSQ
jgi:hypothetical protein